MLAICSEYHTRLKPSDHLASPFARVDTRLHDVEPDQLWVAPTSFGTPPQDLPLLVDTGSAALWAFSTKCQGCGTGAFDVTKSSTFVNTSEPASYAYGSGATTIQGWHVKDTVGISGVTTENAEFAVIDAETNAKLDKTSAGLSGWSWPFTDEDGKIANPVPYIQAKNKQWSEPVFGVYLNRKNPRAEAHGTQSKGDGALTVSGVDHQYFDGELTWTPRREDKKRAEFAWLIDFPHFTANGKQRDLDPSSLAILDTGTTLVFGPPDDVRAFWSSVPGAIDNNDGTWTVDCNRTDIKASFNLAGKDWEFDPTDLIFEDEPGKCFGAIIYQMSMWPLGAKWLVGGTFLKNVYTAFQYDPPQVGLAKLKEGL